MNDRPERTDPKGPTMTDLTTVPTADLLAEIAKRIDRGRSATADFPPRWAGIRTINGVERELKPGANLSRAYLSWAYLSKAYLSRAYLYGARGNEHTILPEGYRVNDDGYIVKENQ